MPQCLVEMDPFFHNSHEEEGYMVLNTKVGVEPSRINLSIKWSTELWICEATLTDLR